MAGPLVISQMTSFAGSLAGSELFPLVATSGGALTNFNMSATGIAAFVVVNFPAQSPNVVFSGPASGVATAVPTFRALVTTDIPLIPVALGGTQTSTLTQNGILFGNAANTVGITGAGNTALVLQSPGPLANPVFGQVSLTAAITGVLGVANGGTNTSTLTADGVMYGNGAATVGITAAGATSVPLLGQGAGNAPSFGVLPVPGGGTNTTTLTQNGIVYGNGSSTVGITAAGNTALVLQSPGPLANPAFGQVSLTAAVTGVLAVANGGTQTSTLTQNGILFGNAANTVGISAAGNTAFVFQSPGPLQSPTFQSLATTIDNAIGSTQGAILTRNATNWIILPPGANGNVLQAQGAAANLQWASAGAGTVTSISAAYGMSSLGVGTSGQTAITSSGTLTRVEFLSAKTAAYTIATTDLGSLITFSSASLATFTLPTPNATALGTGFFFDVQNINTGLLVLLGSACNVNGLATASLNKGQGGRLVIDGANYQWQVGGALAVSISNTAQSFLGGLRLTPFNLGSTTAGATITFDSGSGPIQILSNAGTGTLAAAANDGEIDIMVLNTTNASTLTFSGFTVGANTGSAYTTTSGNKYLLQVRRINGTSTYNWYAMQ